MKNSKKADIALILVTIVWGASFLLTKNAINQMQVFNFLGIRFMIAFFIGSAVFYKKMITIDKSTLKNGIFIGIVMYLAFAFQTVGLNTTTVSKAAFITGLSVILVPIIFSFYKRERIKNKIILSVTMAVIGLALLTLTDGIHGINLGDVLNLVSAFLFALYIIMVGELTHKSDSIAMANIQIAMVGILSFITSIIVETPTFSISISAWTSILTLSVLCTFLAFLVQNVAQKYTSSTHTALIYSLEPVFAAIFGYIFANDVLGTSGIIGATLIVCGMLIAEIDFEKLLAKNKQY